MAKKNKKKAVASDVSQTLVDMIGADFVPKEEPKPEPEPAAQEDEFEALLRSFIETDDTDETGTNDTKEDEIVLSGAPQTPAASVRQGAAAIDLGSDENELAQAYANFLDAVTAIANGSNIPLPDFFFEAENLQPNYKPSTGRKIVADAMLCWDILLKAYPDRLSSLNPSASDEEFLNFAESLTDQNLQLAIISYVEILIDIENCEICYEEKRLKAQRRRIERALYEEYLERQEKRKKFIEAICKKGFPVDAERLITNYFKNATKDVQGAYQALIKNPAVYAPIEISKIKPRLFGLIKPTPKDGIRENHRLGEFLRKLKA